MKVLIAAKGRTVAQDLARLRAVRDAIGPGAELIADANCRMDLDTARAFSRGAVELNLAWLEEPVAGNDRHALASLAAEGRVPIGAGQMEQSADRFDLLTEAGIDAILDGLRSGEPLPTPRPEVDEWKWVPADRDPAPAEAK